MAPAQEEAREEDGRTAAVEKARLGFLGRTRADSKSKREAI